MSWLAKYQWQMCLIVLAVLLVAVAIGKIYWRPHQVTIVPYACWEPVASLQTWRGCPDLSVQETVCLWDERDGKTYTVAKMPDGKCWMTADLRFGGWPDSCVGKYEYQGGKQTRTDQFGLGTLGDCRDQEASKAGYLYNFQAASQRTAVVDEKGDKVVGLCPRGWRLPRGGRDGDLAQLAALRPEVSFWCDIWQGQYSGDAIFSGEIYGQNLFGYYWSATPADAQKAYNLQLNLNDVDAISVHDQSIGMAVRCVQE